MRRSLRSWLWRVPVEQEIDEELDAHVELRTRELIARGMDPASATADTQPATPPPEIRVGPLRRPQRLDALIDALVPMTLLPYQLHIAGAWYLVVAVVLGLAFLGLGAWGFFRQLEKPWARQTFLFSLLYLTGLFLALMLDRGSVA